ncbi:MAG: hypothetical protein IIA88_08065 [Bacteroidetes bacterium]|nr:hypothetical protein [Bacteroidota bacterium]
MTELLRLEIIENDKGGHEDLIFEIPRLVNESTFDTYYFALAIEPKNGLSEIKNAVAGLLKSWKSVLTKIQNGETVHLPIEFSDEYTGCVQVKSSSENFQLNYGYSRREGWSVDPINPINYFNSITDFKSENEKSISVPKIEFLNGLIEQINKLKNKENVG